MRFTDVTVNFNNNMSTSAVSLDTEKAFYTTWKLGLLYKVYNLKFLVSLIKIITSFLSQGKLASVEGLHQGIYKQESHKVPACPPHCTVYI
jgi:hypothetical protein